MHEKQVGDATEAFERLVLVSADGLIAKVAARGHHRKAKRR
jgi:hypothetical protein